MTDEEAIVDALYDIARKLENFHNDIDHRLGSIVSQLEDMNGYLSEINKSLPNPLDVPQ